MNICKLLFKLRELAQSGSQLIKTLSFASQAGAVSNIKNFSLSAICSIAILAGCGGGSGNDTVPTPVEVPKPTDAVVLSSKIINADGGALKAENIELIIPAGALKSSTAITIEKVTTVPPEFSAWMVPSATVYRLSPSGTKFNADITLKLHAPASVNDDLQTRFMWTENGNIGFVPFVREGDYLVAKADHFSLAMLFSWQTVTNTFWNLTKVPVVFADTLIKAAYAVGSVEMALYCKATGSGDEGEEPCSGPKMSDGTYQPLCLGQALTSNKVKLTVNKRTNLCWQPIKPAVSNAAFRIETGKSFDGEVTVLDSDEVRIVNAPQHGTVALETDGSFEFIPAPTYSGSDSFSYVAKNEVGESTVATVEFSIGAALPPVIVLTATPHTITSGSTARITWTSTGAQHCDAEAGGHGPSGSFVTQPLFYSKTYLVSCTGIGGVTIQNAAVTIDTPTRFWSGRFKITNCVNIAGSEYLPGDCGYALTGSGGGAGSLSAAFGTAEANNIRWDYYTKLIVDKCRSNSLELSDTTTEFKLGSDITHIWDHVPRETTTVFKIVDKSRDVITGTFTGEFTARPDSADSSTWRYSGTWEMNPRGPFPKCTAIVKPSFSSGTSDGCSSDSPAATCNWKNLREDGRPGEWLGLP